MAELTRFVALDCEFVAVAPDPDVWAKHDLIINPIDVVGTVLEDTLLEDMVARVSLVNAHLECILDTFVKPTKPVLSYRTPVSGVRKADLDNGEDFKEVRRKVKKILKDRILVGHGVAHDLETLRLSHPKCDIRDTTEYRPFLRMNNYRKPALRYLARQFLGITIQQGEHSSVEDARAVMRVYQKVAADWEKSLGTKN